MRLCSCLCACLCVYIRTKEEVLLFIIVRGNVSEIERERERGYAHVCMRKLLHWVKKLGHKDCRWTGDGPMSDREIMIDCHDKQG